MSNPTRICTTCSSAWSTGIRSIDSMNCCRGIGNRQKLSRSEACAAARRLHWCDVLRILTIGIKVGHYGLRSDDLSTNKLSAGALAANGYALVTPTDGASCAIGSSLGLSFVAPSGGFALGGNSALDQPRSRSSDAESVPGEGSFGGGVVSEPMSRNSMLVSFGMSKFGASPSAAVAITASANLTSGRSHEP